MKKNLYQYKYSVFYSEEDGEYVGTCYEFPSLSAFGENSAEALEEIQNVVREAIDILTEEGRDIPIPMSERDYKGRILLRINPDTHRIIVEEAANRHLSANQYLVSLIESNLYRDPIKELLNKFNLELADLRAEVAELRQIKEFFSLDRYFPQGNEDFVSNRFVEQYQGSSRDFNIVRLEPLGEELVGA